MKITYLYLIDTFYSSTDTDQACSKLTSLLDIRVCSLGKCFYDQTFMEGSRDGGCDGGNSEHV